MNDNNEILKHRGKFVFVKFFRNFVLYLNIFLFTSNSVYSKDDDFYEKCNYYLSQVDKFADECSHKARPFKRIFYPNAGTRGESETFSVYFKDIDFKSRFILGCTLNFEGKISYLGIYYSHKIIDMSKINGYSIAFIDFNSNIGLIIEDSQSTLLAIRRFAIKDTPHLASHKQINCQAANLENYGSASVSDKNQPKYERLPDNMVRRHLGIIKNDNKYNVYFGRQIYPLVFVNNIDTIMVDQKGILLLKIRKNYNDPCVHQKHDIQNEYNIFYEACRSQ